jgi:hypothetical protein
MSFYGGLAFMIFRISSNPSGLTRLSQALKKEWSAQAWTIYQMTVPPGGKV